MASSPFGLGSSSICVALGRKRFVFKLSLSLSTPSHSSSTTFRPSPPVSSLVIFTSYIIIGSSFFQFPVESFFVFFVAQLTMHFMFYYAFAFLVSFFFTINFVAV